jgi:hypothetical protein
LLAELGKLSLAARAYEYIDQLPPPLQQTLRQFAGFSLREEDVLAAGVIVRDRWQVIGQCVEHGDRIRTQRTWLMGEASRRNALLLQFAAGMQPLAASWIPGTAFEGELAFYPGAGMQRALLKGAASPSPAPAAFLRSCSMMQMLDDAATMLAANPWHERLATVLQSVAPVVRDGQWLMVDSEGHCLPLVRAEHWIWLAVSGGHPHDVAVEWDGKAARPLGMLIDGYYYVLTGAA